MEEIKMTPGGPKYFKFRLEARFTEYLLCIAGSSNWTGHQRD